jgi:hypothetical protein
MTRAQTEFVGWWKETVRPQGTNRHTLERADRRTLEMVDAEENADPRFLSLVASPAR